MQRAAIERAAMLAGLELDPSTDITIHGEDPVCDSPFRLGEGASTALALVGQEANRIWQMRGGKSQALSIDMRHAAASLRSYTFVTVDGQELPMRAREGPAVTAIWQCGDGRWIHLHGSFTHTEGILEELGLDMSATNADIAAACMKRNSWELEDALAAKGLCNAVCRTNEEWLAHPQGALLASKPVLEVTKIADGPVVPFKEGPRPLSGVRVLDLTRVLAGPTCARTLAEHGAEALHIASPNLPTITGFEMDTGHGKRQAWLDLNDQAQSDTLKDLIRGADVFSQGFQHKSLERRGFGVQQAAALNPSIIYVSENAFGHEGPWQERPGWEQLAQSTTGVAYMHNPEHPVLAPVAMNDYTTGYFSALGTLMALRKRATEGGSWSVRVSLSQTSMWYYRMGTDMDRASASGFGEVEGFLEEHMSGYGCVRHLAPPLKMSETTPHWELPTAPLGSHEPAWS